MLSIGDLARQTGVQPSAIRYYESIGLLPEPARVSGQRRYDPSARHQVELINAARACGFQIREIQTLIHGFPPDASPSERWESLADRKIAEIDERIQQLQQVRDLLENARQCRCVSLNECAVVIVEQGDSADAMPVNPR